MNKIYQEIDFYLLVIGFFFSLFLPVFAVGCSLASGYYAFKNKHKTIFVTAITVGFFALLSWIVYLFGA